ncbi:hypothetical protein V6N11_035531 [Hibiscus sabdariffa]|uniref:Uncharacterized protein n=2 Tax=Hibiscus sabdariffa TaxID=183260 RepID=A0ABR2R0K8_9ROSI
MSNSNILSILVAYGSEAHATHFVNPTPKCQPKDSLINIEATTTADPITIIAPCSSTIPLVLSLAEATKQYVVFSFVSCPASLSGSRKGILLDAPSSSILEPLSDFYPWRFKQNFNRFLHPNIASRNMGAMFVGERLEKTPAIGLRKLLAGSYGTSTRADVSIETN